MEANNKYMENTIPNFFKNKKIKLSGEENTKPININNSIKDSDDNDQNTKKERMQFLFPNLPKEDINNVLERSEYNIAKAITLIKELRNQQKKLNTLENPMKHEMAQKRRKFRGIGKRNYITCTQKKQNTNENKINNNINTNPHNNDKQNEQITYTQNNINNNINTENKNNNINNINLSNSSNNNTINTNNNSNINIIQENNNINHAQSINLNDNNKQGNNLSHSSNNNNTNTLDEKRTKLINKQIDYLLSQFVKMTDISELKKLLTEIGFPVSKEEKNYENLEEILKEKIKSNTEEKQFIINQYNKHNDIVEKIKQKEEKIDELTCSLANLIEAESDQKIREEKYRSELMEYAKYKYKDNYGPDENY